MPTLPPETLETFRADALAGAGMRVAEARLVARHLVEAEVKNVASHGVNRVAAYLDRFAAGGARPAGEIVLERTGPTVLAVDGGGGLGIPAMERAVDELIAMARDRPIVCAGVRNVAHTGRIGAYGERLAAAGLFAMVFGGGGADRWAVVAAHGGRGGAISTNPWAFAMPGGGAGDVSADFATCSVANGKVTIRRRTGEPVPEGWLVDRDGRPTTSIDDYDDGGALPPAGGHKGYGLAVIAELAGGAMLGRAFEFNWIVIALRKDLFGPDDFDADARAIVERLRATPPAAGVDRVRVPGDPERESEARRRRDGVALHDGVWKGPVEAAARVGVPPP